MMKQFTQCAFLMSALVLQQNENFAKQSCVKMLKKWLIQHRNSAKRPSTSSNQKR